MSLNQPGWWYWITRAFSKRRLSETQVCWCLQLSRIGTSITFSDCFYFAPCRINQCVTIGNHEFMAKELLVNIGKFSWWNCLVAERKIINPDHMRHGYMNKLMLISGYLGRSTYALFQKKIWHVYFAFYQGWIKSRKNSELSGMESGEF